MALDARGSEASTRVVRKRCAAGPRRTDISYTTAGFKEALIYPSVASHTFLSRRKRKVFPKMNKVCASLHGLLRTLLTFYSAGITLRRVEQGRCSVHALVCLLGSFAVFQDLLFS